MQAWGCSWSQVQIASCSWVPPAAEGRYWLTTGSSHLPGAGVLSGSATAGSQCNHRLPVIAITSPDGDPPKPPGCPATNIKGWASLSAIYSVALVQQCLESKAQAHRLGLLEIGSGQVLLPGIEMLPD